MSTAVLMERITEAPPRFKARMAGVFSLLPILMEGFVEISNRQKMWNRSVLSAYLDTSWASL
jgi:hypothetical protein